MLTTEKLDLSYEDIPVVQGISIEIAEGKITALVGPNGSGKSTILRGISRILRPRGGAVLLDGTNLNQLKNRDIAKRLAVLPQSAESSSGLTVEQLVMHGRTPYLGTFGSATENDHSKVQWALKVTDMIQLASKPLAVLSGGQRQRAWIAMALAQDTPTLLLDEPTTHLDMTYQLEILELLQRLNRQEKKTIVMVLHELNHASRYADHLIAIAGGKPVIQGSPADTITPEMFRSVFGVDAEIVPDPRTGDPSCFVYSME